MLAAPVSSSQRQMQLPGTSLHSRQRASPIQTGPSAQRVHAGQALDLAERQAIARERGVDLAHRGVGYARRSGCQLTSSGPGSQSEIAGM